MRAVFHYLLLFGFCTTGLYLSRQYHFINENKTWAEAQRYCRENYIDLASIDNADEELALITTVDIRNNSPVWLGLYDDMNSWKWSLDDDAFYHLEEKSFRNWYVQKPGDWSANRLCAMFSGFNGAWQDNYCSEMLPFFCLEGGTNASESYILVDQYMNWTEAQRYCREHYTDLISVRNEIENQKLKLFLYNNNKKYSSAFWIGLYRTIPWSNKSNWKPEQPDNYGHREYCNAVSIDNSDSGKWTYESCNQTVPFFCYRTMLSASSHQYHFVNESKTWTEAQRYCQEYYTDLATINNMEEMNKLLKTGNGRCSGLAWTGLYDDLDTWKWSLDDDSFYKEGEKMFRGWYHEPDNYNGKELCVIMRSDGKWSDEDCNNHLTFVCYDGRNITGDYIWVNQQMPWAEAQHYCRQHYTDLASVRTQADTKKILNLTGGSNAWIGLYRTRLWSDQNKSTYANWRPTTSYISEQPDNGLYVYWEHGNQQCTAVSLGDSGQWTDEDCLNTFPFICYSKFCTGPLCTHQYHFVTEKKTWTKAQSYCREKYTDLATIDNMKDVERLLDTVYGTYSSLAWIGLYDDLNIWKWSLDDDFFYKEGERSFRNWHIYKPYSNWIQNSLCVYISGFDMLWWPVSCYFRMSFICFDGRENASERYILVSYEMNWTEAQHYCREHYTDLISIRNNIENQRIKSLLHGHFSNVWIGLFRTWSWSDKSNSFFSNWNPGQPDNYGAVENCTAVFTDSGTWADENCGKTFPFICYKMSSVSHQYYFVNINMTWIKAQRYCRANYTDLATIDNMEEMNTLINTVNGSYIGLAWIGLYGDLHSWQWSLDNDTFYKEGEREFRGWYQEPNNYNGKEMCVSMEYTGEWFDQMCTWTLEFVCFNGTNNAYVLISERMTWKEAQNFCRAKHTDLVSVRNDTELQKILSIMHNYSQVWIGLYRERLWSDQSNSSFTYWRPQIQIQTTPEPDNGLYSYGQFGDQHCTAMDYTGKWTDENCLESFPFFCYCESMPGAVIGLQMKIKVRGNMPDSQIQELIVMQLRQELIRLGMSRKIRVRVRNIRKINT